MARGNGDLVTYREKAASHLETAAKFHEIADVMPEHPLHRELVGNEKLVMLAIRQMLIDVAASEIKIAQSLCEEIHDD